MRIRYTVKKIIRHMRSKVVYNFLFAYLGIVIFAFGLLGVLAGRIIRDNLRKEEVRFIENKLDIIVEDLENQYLAAWDMLVDIATMQEFDLSSADTNKYKELQMLERLSVYKQFRDGNGFYEDYFLKYAAKKTIYHSDEKTSFAEVYFTELFGEQECSGIVTFLDQIIVDPTDNISLYQGGGKTLFIYPLKKHYSYNRQEGALVFLVTDKGLEGWMTKRLGSLGGNVAVYYNGICLLDQSETAVAPDFEVSTSKGNFIVQYWKEDRGIYDWTQWGSLKMVAIIVASVLMLVVIGCFAAYRNYLPMRRILNKFNGGVNEEVLGDWEKIESFLDALINGNERKFEQINKLHCLLREHLLKTIVTGKYNDDMQHLVTLLNLEPQESQLCVMKFVSNESELESLDKIMSDDEEELTGDVIASLYYDEAFYLLIAIREEDEVQDLQEFFLELLNIWDYRGSMELVCSGNTLKELCIADRQLAAGQVEQGCESAYTEACTEAYAAEESKQNSTAYIAVEYINEHYRDYDISLEKIAEELQVTSTYLSKIIRQYVHMGYKDYLTELRMKEAKRLLLETDDSVVDICKQVGYSHVSYFITLFQKCVGKTPSKYRAEEKRGENEYNSN